MVGVTERRTLKLRQTRVTVEQCGKLGLVRKSHIDIDVKNNAQHTLAPQQRPGRPAKFLERARLAGVIQREAVSVAIRTTDGSRPTKCGKGPGTEEEEDRKY
ncbi:jg27876 [Pararge aegeria aegeria]|uniref:Jg27876 protein n=1 Tax=Pararge aegeria aegeria TaxID=348720 RepID=A0A8S4RWA3_9NEOP|nr:jg27876 [Pararge aegeria aegeria]